MLRTLKIVRSAISFLILSSTPVLFTQTPASATSQGQPVSAEPLIVDVHPSPYRPTVDYRTNVSDQRFDMRDATMLDLISFAYKLRRDESDILGGPTWIDFDRFDLIAKIASLKAPSLGAAAANSVAPPTNSYDQIRPTVQRVLAERFHLTYHTEDRPLPGYVMTVAKDGPKFTEAKDPDSPGSCKPVEGKAVTGQYTMICTSETMAELVSRFGGVFPQPLVDHTGLKKSYDFTLKIVYDLVPTQDGQGFFVTNPVHSITEGLKQIGLVVAPGTVPRPVFVVDSVDRTPTPNAPGIADLIPPPRDLEFEVATIKPAANDEQRRIAPRGSQLIFGNYSLQELLTEAWQLPTGAMLGNAPPWLGRVRYTVNVKLPPDIDAQTAFEDRDLIDRMLQKLLVDRFQIKYHWGEQTQDGWVLLAGTPKMKKADPDSRTFCDYGPPKGEKDMRTAAGSPYDSEFHCQNVTMDQFADLMQPMARTEIKNRVPNKTGLTGSYNFTLYYTTGHKIRVDATANAAAAKEAGDATAAPVEAVSLEDAFRKQLGLKLERQSSTFPALVLDHIEQTPTEN